MVLDPDDDRAREFGARASPAGQEPPDPLPGVIDDGARRELIYRPEVWPLQEAFALLWGHLPSLLGLDPAALGARLGERVSPQDPGPLPRTFFAVARALGVAHPVLHLRPEATDTTVVIAAPPAVVAPADLADGRSAAELRFVLARALELTLPATLLAAGLPPPAFARLMQQVLRAFHPRHSRGRRDLDAAEREAVSVFRRALPFKVARRLGELFRESELTFDSRRWRRAVTFSANRVGLVVCGDVPAALGVLLARRPELDGLDPADLLQESEEIRDLLQFALGDAYQRCREALLGRP
jgi:hypothetical protein